MSDFKKLVSARFLFTLAVQMQAVVVGWRIYDLTGDPLALGLVGLAEAVPALSLAIYAGYLVDHNRPLKIYRFVVYGSLLSVAVLIASVSAHTPASTQLQIAALYVASIFTGTARAFSGPSVFALIPRLMKREHTSKAQAWMSTAMQTGRVVGPAVGGLVFGFFGAMVSFITISVLLIGALCATYAIKTVIEAPIIQNKSLSFKENLALGAKFVFGHPILFPSMTLDMVAVMFGGVTALLPIFAKEVLMVGPRGLGALRAAPALGAALMGVYLGKRPLRGKVGPTFFAMVAGFGLCILVFAASKSFLLSFAALAFSGAFDGVSMVIRNTAVQLASPDHMRGRISAISFIFIGSSNELGEFESGIAAKILGTVPAAYFGGLVCMASVAVAAWLSPALRKLELE